MARRPIHPRRWLFGFLAATIARAPLRAQVPPAPSCVGKTISAITINPERPGFTGQAARWRMIAHALGLHHTTTREGVIRAYLLFKPGEVCTQEKLSESQRVLRELPFLADATVTASPDSANGVIAQVVTVDEVPVIMTGSLRGGIPAALSLGTENLAGLGTRVVLGGERDGVYRGMRRVEAADYGLFGSDIFGRTAVVRDHLGGHAEAELAHPFLSSLQRTAWQASYRYGRDYPSIVGPFDDNETVGIGTVQWSVSGAIRRDIGKVVTLLGPVALGSRLDRRTGAMFVTDSGPIAVADSALLRRFVPYTATRAGALLGARRVRFVTRQGLDALFATQDVMVGWQVGGVVAPTIMSRTYRDVLTAPSAYVGAATSRVVAFTDLEGEFTNGNNGLSARSSVINGRVVAYATPSSRVVMQVLNNFSLIDQPHIPTQLTMSDPIGGPRGYLGSKLAGGRRDLTRAEIRWSTPNAFNRGDLGVAVFADAATLWAADVPYGSSVSRQSVGISLLGAYPSRSKRVYRVDVALPLERDRGRGIEIRFSSGDPTSRNATEPYDVTASRQAPIPASLVTWPVR